MEQEYLPPLMNIDCSGIVGVAAINADTHGAAWHTCLKALAILFQAHTFATFTACFMRNICSALLKLRVESIWVLLEDGSYGV